jgi:hypothetical protein
MKTLSKKLAMLGGEPTHWCPGCGELHRIDVNAANPNTGSQWTWDGNVDIPTFSPSINIVGRCHYFIVAGQIQFCKDSRHKLAGQTVDLPDLPDWTVN